jgi:flagellar biosynthesis protein FlhF
MRVKSYFAGTVEAAMTLAGRELGEEAMLVYSREAAPEARYLGKYEVVFALPHAEAPPTPAVSAPPPPASPVLESSPNPGLVEVLESMRRQMEAIADKVDRINNSLLTRRMSGAYRPAAAMNGNGPPQELADLVAGLGLDEDLGEEVMARALQARTEAPTDSVPTVLRKVLLEMSRETVGETSPENARIIVLVGSPGSGKTTALVKLAARLSRHSRRPVHLISFDTCRISGAEQLRTYAGILGMGFQAVETVGGLLQVLEECIHKEYILIDTAGLTDKDVEAASDLEMFLRLRPDAEVHLTLTASTKPDDLSRMVDRFERFRPNKLLFTRMDETVSYGCIWAESVKRCKPVSFLCDGQQIPEDIREASPETVVELLISGLGANMPAVNGAAHHLAPSEMPQQEPPPPWRLEEPKPSLSGGSSAAAA